ncbi:MAG: tetratricopeptide repeat protein [Phycisphaerae bacterium]|nr:tetratricopeptide repeat protein [Phycisphaerae bacterium]
MSDTETTNTNGSESQTAGGKAKPIRMTLLQVLLVMNMVLVLLVAGVALNLIPKPTLRAAVTPLEPAPQVLTTPGRESLPADPTQRTTPKTRDYPRQTSPDRFGRRDQEKVLPWEEVERLFAARRYDEAYTAYKALMYYAPRHSDGRLLNEYFQLRMGQCLARTDQTSRAREELNAVTQSSSPILRALAWFELATIDVSERRYLAARTKAYHVLASLGAMEHPMALEADCAFMIGRVLTEKVRGFQTAEHRIRWPSDRAPDPFAGLDKDQIYELFQEGAAGWKPSLKPSLEVQTATEEMERWRVRCSQMTIEEVLNQFGRKIGKDVKWYGVAGGALRRPVDFFMRSASSQKISETAAGMAGLIGRFTLDGIVVYDPQDATSVAKQQNLISREAISAWRLFFLRHPTDPRIPDGRFALAAVNEWSGEKINAIHEYELLARRHKRAAVAPKALLQAAKLKIGMMNFAKARQDLVDLLDLYPDCPGVDKVYLMLAQVNETAGRVDEAIRSYEYLYYRNLSEDSRRIASMGAGRCYSRQGKHSEATQWLARYAAIVRKPNPDDYVDAYFMMAQSETEQKNYSMAVQAYHRGLAGRPEIEKRIPALLELVSVHILQEDFISALGVLNHLAKETLTKEQECRKAVLTARVLRELGLAEKARSVLKLQLSVTDTGDLKAEVGIELARCHMAVEDYDSAQKLLTEILPLLQNNRSLWLAEVLLAEVCLKLDEPDQAIGIVRKVRASAAPIDLQRQASKILGEAFLRKREYEKAALAFTGLKKNLPPDSKENP